MSSKSHCLRIAPAQTYIYVRHCTVKSSRISILNTTFVLFHFVSKPKQIFKTTFLFRMWFIKTIRIILQNKFWSVLAITYNSYCFWNIDCSTKKVLTFRHK